MDWAKNCTVTNGVPGLDCVPYAFLLLVNGLLFFVGVFAAYFIIISGIKLITSQGDAKQLDTAHKTFFYALIGLIIIFTSFFIVNLVATVTGVTCINQFGFDNCVGGSNASSSGGSSDKGAPPGSDPGAKRR